MDKEVDVKQLCALAAQMASPGQHQQRSGSGQGRDCPLLLCPCNSPHLQYYILVCPQHRRDVEQLEWVLRKVTKIFSGLEHLSYGEMLRELDLSSLEKVQGRPQCDLPVFGGYKQEGDQICTQPDCDRIIRL